VFGALTVRGGAIYAGGLFFTGLGGKPFTTYPLGDFTGAIDIRTGDALAWDPHPNGEVSVLCASGERMLMGGLFSSVRDWIPRTNLAALDLNTGLPTSWAPTFDGTVRALIAYGGKLYLGGQLFSVNGLGTSSVASLDPVTGVLENWNPGCNGIVRTMAAAGGKLY